MRGRLAKYGDDGRRVLKQDPLHIGHGHHLEVGAASGAKARPPSSRILRRALDSIVVFVIHLGDDRFEEAQLAAEMVVERPRVRPSSAHISSIGKPANTNLP